MADRTDVKFVAIVDDDAAVRTALLGLMRAAGLTAQAFASAEEYLRSGALAGTACIVADVRMPGMSGLDLQAHLNARRAGIPVVFITAHGDAVVRGRAMAAGAIGFLQKPFDDQELLDAIRTVTKA